MHKAGTERGDGTKRDGSEPKDTTSRKKRNKKKDLGLGMGDDADNEDEERQAGQQKNSSAKTITTIQNWNSKIKGRVCERTLNRGMSSKEEYNRFNTLYKDFISFHICKG